MLWIVDGMNVVGSRPDGWWRDRPAAFGRLVDELSRFAASSGDEVLVVFDGRPVQLPVAGIEVAFAPAPGPDAADDVIVEQLARRGRPVRVVTSDRALAGRARREGAEVVSARAFRSLLDATGRGER